MGDKAARLEIVQHLAILECSSQEAYVFYWKGESTSHQLTQSLAHIHETLWHLSVYPGSPIISFGVC